MVPHGELKLIICDNLSASENSNMSTKLREPQRGVGERRREKKVIKEKAKEKRKGQLETLYLHGGKKGKKKKQKKKRLPCRLNGKCF